jgi:alkanesulfonate monooxygenase SsuD/methylene tetrahydromethanopterin reductase-like flavin-dependent oxidoreductase (luciferase family)
LFEEKIVAPPRKMHLVAYLKTGSTASYARAWRHPAAPLHDIWDPERYEHPARTLEAARFDAGFFADGMGVPDIYKNTFADYLGRGGQMNLLDPMTVLPLMARVTTRLGLGTSLSTTFNEPYQLARGLGSLDLLSKGRAAWNVVTSANNYEARNFGMAQTPPKDARYDRADEVLASSSALCVDLCDLESAKAAEAVAGNQGIQGSRDRVSQVAKAQGISFAHAVREPRGLLAGTPGMIADYVEDWFKDGACDGFVLPPPIFPGTYEEFGRIVVPELQRRGLFRTEYAGRTLRENLKNAG